MSLLLLSGPHGECFVTVLASLKRRWTGWKLRREDYLPVPPLARPVPLWSSSGSSKSSLTNVVHPGGSRGSSVTLPKWWKGWLPKGSGSDLGDKEMTDSKTGRSQAFGGGGSPDKVNPLPPAFIL